MAREIGLSRLTVFPLEDEYTPTYGSPIAVPYVVNIEVSKTIAEYSAYGDNVAEVSSSRETGAELSTEVSSHMPPKLESTLTGKKYINGALVATTDDVKTPYGVAWETVKTNGKLRRYFYNNCVFSKDEQSNETISDSVTAQTYNLKAKAVPLPTTKELMMVMDEEEIEQLIAAEDPKKTEIQTVWDEWFTTAPRPVI